MSGEPKTLTPQEMTLEEALAAVRAKAKADGPTYKVTEVRFMPFAHYPWWVEVAYGDVKVYADWPPALSFALGAPVVARDDAAELRETAEWSGLLSDALGRCADYLEAVLQTSIDDLEPEEADAFSDAVRTAGNLLARFDGGKPAPKSGDAAELKAAVNELLASGGARGIERRLQLIDNGRGQRDRLEAAYARVCALAATGGQP